MAKNFRTAAIVVLVVISIVFAGGSVASARPLLPSLEQIFPALRLPPTAQQKLTSSFSSLRKTMAKRKPTAGQIGVALVPVGGDNGLSFGPLKAGRAWSTFKVPVSLASQRRNGVAVAGAEAKAIMLSDNDAASDLWGSLGGSRQAVDAVTGILREGHDAVTRVSSELDLPKSYPGYTQWALIDQARFGAHLPCMSGAEHIVRLMSSVAPNQQWGVAKVGRSQGATTAVKGGWGPVSDTRQGYIVRQIALINTTRGQVAVSMAAIPRSGSFDDGKRMLTQIGGWLSKNMASLPFGQCPPV
ncbi:hypothetical protein [Gordonia sp. CPCC 205333]|uniref:hypothetical protein n=1 Tax=Gordonia sp. CPCC 205333 TaxID=3140790 RepID=UPI003AF38A9A